MQVAIKIKILLTLLFSFNVSAQSGSAGWAVENIHGPSQIGIIDTIPVDINKDGLMDLVSASFDDGNLRAYINLGNFEFEQQYISTDVMGAFRISSTDFNNDGEIDFLIPSIETQEVIALIADPDAATFGYQKKSIANNVLLPTDAQAGDFNKDGLMDVVSLSFEENVLLLHIQDKQGGFTTTTLSKSPQRPRKLVVEDFNNDQMLDILVASSGDNSIRLYTNEGNSSFTESLISNQMTGVRYIARCDDAKADYVNFVAGVTGGDQVVFFENLEDNTFASSVIDDDLLGANAMHCADINGDSEIDLIGISATLGSIYTYSLSVPNNKNLIAGIRDGYVTTSFATFENAAEPKIITQAYFENRNLLYDPNTKNLETVVWEDFPEGATKVSQADINNDGIQDTVATSFRDDRVQWYDGRDNRHVIIAENIDGANDLVLGDFNRDGFIDVVTAASFDNRFYLHLNDQSEGFVTSVLFEGALFANALAVTDFDQDGWLDVLGSSGSDDRLRWFKFSEQITSTIDLGVTGDAPNDIEAGDIDADGDIDLLVVNFFSGDVVFYQNDGNENFTSEIISSGWLRPYASLLRNNAQTGLVDIIITMSTNNQIIELNQPVFQQFKEKLVYDGSQNPRKLAYNTELKELYVTAPDDRNIISIGNFSEPKTVAENYLGVSDINTTDKSYQLISSSIDLNSVTLLTVDLIFSSGFSDPH